MKLTTQPYKGTRDFYPDEKRLQDFMFSKIRETVKSYGYEEYDAPLLEPLELYKAKSGAEIVAEQTYSFTDRGGREVAIRPEMTPTVSRMVAARRQQLVYPLRWFSIPNLWRYERPQRGRLREHWQLNVDIFGVESYLAELELIMIADQLLKSFGADASMYRVKISHRQLLDQALAVNLGLKGEQSQALTKLIDRRDKLEHSDFIAQVDSLLTPAQRESGVNERLLSLLSIKDLNQLPKGLLDSRPVKELENLMAAAIRSGLSNLEFDIGLVRGFDYYNGIVFELYDTSPDNKRSMMGGGRYDALVGMFNVAPLPTAGFGLGDTTLRNFLDLHHLLPVLAPEIDLIVAVVGDAGPAAQNAAAQLRLSGLKVAIDYSGRRLGDQLKAAQKKGLRFVMVVGQEEVRSKLYTLRDLKSASENKYNLARIADILAKQ